MKNIKDLPTRESKRVTSACRKADRSSDSRERGFARRAILAPVRALKGTGFPSRDLSGTRSKNLVISFARDGIIPPIRGENKRVNKTKNNENSACVYIAIGIELELGGSALTRGSLMMARVSVHLCRSRGNWDWMVPCQSIYAGANESEIRARSKEKRHSQEKKKHSPQYRKKNRRVFFLRHARHQVCLSAVGVVLRQRRDGGERRSDAPPVLSSRWRLYRAVAARGSCCPREGRSARGNATVPRALK